MKSSGEYADWVLKLVKECLPLPLQRKILSCAPLTRDEARKFMGVVQLAAQAKSLGDSGEILRRMDDLKRSLHKSRREHREILWHASGNDPRYAPEDERSSNAVRREMVRRAVEELDRGVLKPKAIFQDLIEEYAGIPGAYTSIETFRRAAYRALSRD